MGFARLKVRDHEAAGRGRRQEQQPASVERAHAATGVRFGEPVIVHGQWNDSTGLRLDGNESMMDSFFSLASDAFMFGQYENHLARGEAVFVASNDSGRSWHLSQVRRPIYTVSPRCQKVLDQYCNNEKDVGANCMDLQKQQFGRSMAPYYARYNQGLKFGLDWRCYSHESLSPDLKHWSPTSKTPSAFCSAPGAALQEIVVHNSLNNNSWAGAEQALTGHGKRAPGTLRTLGQLETRGPTSFGSAGTFEYSLAGGGELKVEPSGRGTSFTGLPRPLLTTTPNIKGKPYKCMGTKSFYEPVVSLTLHDGTFLACSIVCFADSPTITLLGGTPYANGSYAGRSLVAWRSTDGYDWKFAGIITDAKDMMAAPTRSLGGNSEENDLALMADGKTIMVVMRTDGACQLSTSCGNYWH